MNVSDDRGTERNHDGNSEKSKDDKVDKWDDNNQVVMIVEVIEVLIMISRYNEIWHIFKSAYIQLSKSHTFWYQKPPLKLNSYHFSPNPSIIWYFFHLKFSNAKISNFSKPLKKKIPFFFPLYIINFASFFAFVILIFLAFFFFASFSFKKKKKQQQ